MIKSVLAGLCAVALLFSAACSGDDDDANPDRSSATEQESADTSDDLCADFRAAGGNLATIGLYQWGMPKESLASDLTGRLEVMNEVTPPEEIAEAWSAWSDHYEAALEVVSEAEAGESVFDPELNSEMTELGDESAQIRDYLGENCFA